jgi:tetratricopeptide (TPR) repeat protein
MLHINQRITGVVVLYLLSSCQSLQTGGKVVDRERGEIIISTAGDQRSALPEGTRDTSISKARQRSADLVRSNPKDVKALLALAQLQLVQDFYDEAEETSRKVLLLDLKNTEAKKVLAQVALRRGNEDLALIFLTSLGGEQSKDSNVHNMLGLIAMRRGDNGDAMRLWKQSLSLNPGDISVRMNMGVMYLKNSLFAQAAAQFERVLKAAPNHQDAQLHLAIIDASRGKNAEAIETYKAILAKDSDNPLALYNLAMAQKNLSQNDAAITSLKRYIKVSPERSPQTDHAFAVIEDLNAMAAQNGSKQTDEELQSLALELDRKKSDRASKADQSRKDVAKNESLGNSKSSKGRNADVQVVPKNDTQNSTANTSTRSDKAAPISDAEAKKPEAVTDSDIEALEKQLRAPAH